jgi:predicted nucleic-acid-binding Zn-ribbon protein
MVCPKCGGEMEVERRGVFGALSRSPAAMFDKFGVELRACKSCGYIELYRKK